MPSKRSLASRSVVALHSSSHRVVAVALVCSFLASCASFSPVGLPAAPATATDVRALVKVGDVVRIVTTDRRRVEFRVLAVEASALVGEGGQRVAYGDIGSLERESFDPRSTVLAVVMVPTVGLGVLALLYFLLGGGNLGGLGGVNDSR